MAGEGSHVVKIVGGDVYLDSCPGEGFSLFAHDDVDKLLTAVADARSNLVQISCALDGGKCCPSRLCCLGGIKCFVNIFNRAFGLTADDFFR